MTNIIEPLSSLIKELPLYHNDSALFGCIQAVITVAVVVFFLRLFSFALTKLVLLFWFTPISSALPLFLDQRYLLSLSEAPTAWGVRPCEQSDKEDDFGRYKLVIFFFLLLLYLGLRDVENIGIIYNLFNFLSSSGRSRATRNKFHISGYQSRPPFISSIAVV